MTQAEPTAKIMDMTQHAALLPRDEFNQELESNVHPPQWRNPTPTGRYNLVVIGAGTAGLVTAAGAAGLGAKVALVERALMGGDCLNVGCVPSKAIIAAARTAAAVQGAGDFGVNVPSGASVDFAAAMERMRRLRARISPHDSARRFQELGVDVYFGEGRFVDSGTLDVSGTRLQFKRAVIATGSQAGVSQIPGFESIDYLTNETLFSLTELPRRFGVIGAGPIGCEMAQAFARLGSEVFLVEAEHGVLPREERDGAEIVQRALARDGVKLLCCGKSLQIKNNSGIRLTVESHGHSYDEPNDKLLVAVGRIPNVEGMNLEAVGVEYDKKGVKVNDHLQTTNPRIYAAGDVCSPYQFTHAADFMARIVIQNALFMGRAKASRLTIPWCTYTSPELAHVGLYEHEANQKEIETESFVQEFRGVDRAVLDGEDDGLVKVLLKKGSDRILGATIVAPHAGDLIAEITLAMTHKLGLKKIGSTIHPYPTQAEAVRKLGDSYNRTRLTPLVKKMLAAWLRWTR
ncbi:MAG: mercuric reductase [Planctomycetes bacterium]|nr:mercuric reductase [Planctomycetota bacterium]